VSISVSQRSVSQRYVDACLAGTGELRHAVARAPLPPALARLFRANLLPRPWFVQRSGVEAFAGELVDFFDLLVSLPQRLFDGDLDRYCAAVGVDERSAALLRRGSTGRPTLLGRADVYHDGAEYKLLEFNLGSELGGLDMPGTNRALLRVPEFKAFADDNELDYVDTTSRLATGIRRAGATVTSDEPVVALLEDNGSMAKFGPWHVALREALARFGLHIRLGEIGDVGRHPGKVTLRGEPVDVVIRNFSVRQIVQDPRAEAALQPILRAHDEGLTALYTTLDSGLFSNKGALALLSDSRSRAEFSARELALVDRVLPWTRTLDEYTTADLLDYCEEHRTELILKPRIGSSGTDMFVGWETSEPAWREALRACTRRGYIAQARVFAKPEPVCDPDTGAVEDWSAVLGIYVDDDGYAGTYARALPTPEATVIARSTNARTRAMGVFSHP
jgi:hypothetical protein